MKADVVVVGAGVNGLSTAYHLARSGVKNVIVVERRHLAAGASGKSGALVRTHYTNEPETRLAFESHKYFSHWSDMVGGDCGFQKVGLLVFAAKSDLPHLEANVAMQREVGANARLLRAEDVREIDPDIWCGDVTHVAYEPDSGYADPNATAYSFARAARGLGVQFMLDTAVTQVRTQSGRTVGVETTAGPIDAPVVVVCAGAWANRLLQPLGYDFGLRPCHARVSLFRNPPGRGNQCTTVIDHIHNTWMRPDGERVLIGAEHGAERGAHPDAYGESVPQDYIALCHEQLVKRVPIMRHSTTRGNWAGVLMISPDSRPIIDQLPETEGLFCMAGDSGTSFKTSPAIGKCLAEWITEGQSKTVNLHPFRATRFAEGKPWIDEHDYGTGGAGLTISR